MSLIKIKFIEEANILFGDFYIFRMGKKMKIIFSFFFPFFLMEKKYLINYRNKFYNLFLYNLYFEKYLYDINENKKGKEENINNYQIIDIKKKFLFLREKSLNHKDIFQLEGIDLNLYTMSDFLISKKFFNRFKTFQKFLKTDQKFLKSLLKNNRFFYGFKDLILDEYDKDLNLLTDKKNYNNIISKLIFFEYNIIYMYRFCVIWQKYIWFLF